LRELHGDFGLAGLLIGPYLLGLFTSILWFRLRRTGTFLDLSVAGFFYILVGMSIFTMASRIGACQVYLIAAVVISYFLDRRKQRVLHNPLLGVSAHA
jgi:hypothetical protein